MKNKSKYIKILLLVVVAVLFVLRGVHIYNVTIKWQICMIQDLQQDRRLPV